MTGGAGAFGGYTATGFPVTRPIITCVKRPMGWNVGKAMAAQRMLCTREPVKRAEKEESVLNIVRMCSIKRTVSHILREHSLGYRDRLR